MFCNSSIIVHDEGWRKHAVGLRCRSWNCKSCAPERKRELIAKAIAGQPQRALTLTSRRAEGQTPEQAARALSRAFRLIIKRTRRKYGANSFEFIAVFEATKLGWPHLHVLQRGSFIPQEQLSAWMQELIDSPVVWIEYLHNPKHAARYMAKYIGKAPGKFGTLKRYWQSKSYDENREWKERAPIAWQIEQRSVVSFVQAHRNAGWHAVLIGQHEARATAPGIHIESGPTGEEARCSA